MMYQVEDQLEGIMLDLLNLKRNPGQNEQQFIASYSHEQRKVGDIQTALFQLKYLMLVRP
jgi:hypothetical protein